MIVLGFKILIVLAFLTTCFLLFKAKNSYVALDKSEKRFKEGADEALRAGDKLVNTLEEFNKAQKEWNRKQREYEKHLNDW